jgi:Prolyl-tRNA synthetase
MQMASSGPRRWRRSASALINLKPGDGETDRACETLYAGLQAAGLDTLYDDTEERPGAQFKTMDLIGLPWQVIVGPKGLAAGEVEVKKRASGEKVTVAPADVIKMLHKPAIKSATGRRKSRVA